VCHFISRGGRQGLVSCIGERGDVFSSIRASSSIIEKRAAVLPVYARTRGHRPISSDL
jgi:hypothetical protein